MERKRCGEKEEDMGTHAQYTTNGKIKYSSITKCCVHWMHKMKCSQRKESLNKGMSEALES